jgi:hypothetical protein
MTREEAIKIITQEGLENYNLNENRYNRENEVVIKCESDTWVVYATDERASTVTGSRKIFGSEEEAWDNLIKRLRADKVLREL